MFFDCSISLCLLKKEKNGAEDGRLYFYFCSAAQSRMSWISWEPDSKGWAPLSSSTEHWLLVTWGVTPCVLFQCGLFRMVQLWIAVLAGGRSRPKLSQRKYSANIMLILSDQKLLIWTLINNLLSLCSFIFWNPHLKMWENSPPTQHILLFILLRDCQNLFQKPSDSFCFFFSYPIKT